MKIRKQAIENMEFSFVIGEVGEGIDEKLIKYINQLDKDIEHIENDRFNKTKASDMQLLIDVQDDLKEILGDKYE